jgi:hypothetical protein
MPLSPADFYAYSQATGAPVADTPEKRARQAPEVHAFRQQQLQAPKEGPSLLDVLGTTAAIAGVGAGAYGLGRLLGRRAVPRQVGKVIIEDEGEAVRRARATNVRTEPAPSRVPTTSERQQAAEEFTRQAREERPRGVVVSNIPLEQNIANPWNAPYVRQAPTEQRPSVSNVQKFLPEEEYVSPYRKGPTYRDLYPGKVEAQRISPEVLQARRQASAEQLERIRQATPGTYQLELGGEVQPTLRTIRSQEPSSFLTQAGAEQLGLVGTPGEYPLNPATGQPFSYVKTAVPISAKPAQTNLFDYLAGTGRMGTAANVEPASLVDVQHANLPNVANQAVNAVETAEDQLTGVVHHQLQRNENLDLSQTNLQQQQFSSETTSAQRFLERERMEIASELGEQNLPASPGRIEAELTRRLSGSTASEYGPKYTARKQALQMGATYGGEFFENLRAPSVNVGGVEWPAGSSDFRQAVITEDTARRAEDYVTRAREKALKWAGDIRVEVEPKINEILIERQNLARSNAERLLEQQNMHLASGNQRAAAALEPQIQAMREIWKDPFLGQHREGEMKLLAARVNAAEGEAYANLENIQKRFPTSLVSDVEEGKRIFYQTSTDPRGTKVDMSMLDPTWEEVNEPVENVVLSLGGINPATVELRSGQRPSITNIGEYGENLEPLELQAASGTAIRGVGGIPFIQTSDVEPMSAKAKADAQKAAYVASLRPVEEVRYGRAAISQRPKQDIYKGGMGLYGLVAKGYPEGAQTKAGEYTQLYSQQPSMVYKKGVIDPVTNAPSVWSRYSDEVLGQMSLMGDTPEMRQMAQKTLNARESVRMSEAIRKGEETVPIQRQRVGSQTQLEIPGLRARLAETTERGIPMGQSESARQLELPGIERQLTANRIMARVSPAERATQQLSDYMIKMQQRKPVAVRATPQVTFQPELF